MLGLRDSRFSSPLAPTSLHPFVFRWLDPDDGFIEQMTWTRLPRGLKNSPTMSDDTLHEDLGEYRQAHPIVHLLQYVDDLLIAAYSLEARETATEGLWDTVSLRRKLSSARLR